MTQKQLFEGLQATGILTVRDALDRIAKSPYIQDYERWCLLTVVLREMALAQKFDLDRKLTLPEE